MNKTIVCWACLTALALLVPGLAGAQEAVPATAEQIAELTKKIAEAKSSGDNAWVLTSAALVLMMTAPGLILFYGGLVRTKNVLSVIMQSVFLMAIVSIIWAVYGYSIAFSQGNAFFGGFDYLFLKGVGGDPQTDYAATIPHQTWMIFQLMFAIITPALITGAFAERFRFKALVPFMIIWVTFVYLPLAHMVWGKGGYLNAWLGPDNKIPALDFAGGTVVHISSGFSALVCALYLGKRKGYPGPQFAPHSLVLSAIGAGLLWVGWFGFNSGSALNAGALASAAFVSTHFSAAAAALSWIAIEWLMRGKPSLLGGISGAVAGLVAVTPAAGYVTPMSGLIIGLIAGVVCFLAVTKVKSAFGYDDSLDVFGVHGVGGLLGAILTGIFATKAVNAPFGDGAVGLLEGNAGQVLNQLIASAIAIGMGGIGTLVTLFLVDKTIGITATADEQEVGLDIVDHGEAGYHSDSFGGSNPQIHLAHASDSAAIPAGFPATSS